MHHRFGYAVRLRPWLAAFAGVGLFVQGAAPADADLPELEEVIVTAQKREQVQFEVPLSVTAVPGKALDNLGIDNALGLSYKVAGLVVQEGAPGNQIYTIRGIGNSVGLPSLVGVYLDEVDITKASTIGQYDISLYDLERVEVLRGPQGTLYGAGATGGVVRFITRRPQLDVWSSRAEASVFAQERGDPGYEAKAVLNLPLVEDRFGLRCILNTHDWGGWIDHPAANREDVNDNRMTDFRLRALWQATSRLTVNGTAIVHRNEGGGTNVANLQPYSASLYQSFIDPIADTPFVDDYEHYSLTANFDFSAVTLTSATGYTAASQQGANGRRFEFAEPLVPGWPESTIYDGLNRYWSESDLLTQELRLTPESPSPLDWTGGIYFRQEQARDNYEASRSLGGELVAENLVGAQSGKSTSWSLYFDAGYALNDRWTLGTGARYFEDARSQSLSPDGSGQQARFDDFSPRVYVSFAPGDRLFWYANVSQGFRTGGFNDPLAVEFGAPGTYGPENVTSFELGGRYRSVDGRVRTEFALFRSDYTDMQGWGAVPGELVDVIHNIGESRVDGVEWAVEWRPVDALRLHFSGNVIDARFVELNAGNTSHLPGDPVDQVADYGWSVHAEYHFWWPAERAGHVLAGYDRQGPVYFTDRSFGLSDPFGVSDTLGFLYATFGVRIGPAIVEVFGRNLLDEDGLSNPYAIGAMETQPRPRVIGVRLAGEFR